MPILGFSRKKHRIERSRFSDVPYPHIDRSSTIDHIYHNANVPRPIRSRTPSPRPIRPLPPSPPPAPFPRGPFASGIFVQGRDSRSYILKPPTEDVRNSRAEKTNGRRLQIETASTTPRDIKAPPASEVKVIQAKLEHRSQSYQGPRAGAQEGRSEIHQLQASEVGSDKDEGKHETSKENMPHQTTDSVVSADATTLKITKAWIAVSGGTSHVEYLPDQHVPLQQGRFLGRGTTGEVHETITDGHAFAWKRRYCRYRIGESERKEIEILKKLSYQHIVQLIGTYTHRQFLGLLLYPVAVCDLGTFLEDCDAMLEKATSDHPQDHREQERQARFERLGVFDDDSASATAYLLPKIGCLTSAVEYLHDQEIRHKDLKPSNILLTKDNVWLTDFGSATDFSLLSASATENGGGTPRYFAPEVATFQPSGRAAYIFSLGCIFLEILAIISLHPLEKLKVLRPEQDRSFQANIHRIDEWFSMFRSFRGAVCHFLVEVRSMLDHEPKNRPSAKQLRARMSVLDQLGSETPQYAFFGDCCSTSYITVQEHKEKVSTVEKELARSYAVRDMVLMEMDRRHKEKISLKEQNEHQENILAQQRERNALNESNISILKAEIQLLKNEFKRMHQEEEHYKKARVEMERLLADLPQ